VPADGGRAEEKALAIQETALKAAGCELIRTEKMSGTKREGRAELELLLEFVREGDELVVTRIDRLARSIGDLQDIVRSLKAKGVALRAAEQPIDTSTAAGKCFLDMLGVFAEFETNLRKERQLEGIAKAKAAGVYKGRKRKVPIDEVKSSRRPAAQSPKSPKRSTSRGWPSIGRWHAGRRKPIQGKSRAQP
jgi:DNA invertase Pin-like site-specific DNA recombinase